MGAAAGAGGGNIFQQSAGAMGQALQTLGGLSQFQPAGFSAATAGPTALYGGATVERTTPFGGANVGSAAQMQAARLGSAAQMQGVGQVGDITAGQLSQADLGQYMNPYTQQVIERGQSDIERQRQMAAQQQSARAGAAGAFGGSRHGVAEGVTAGEYGRMGMDFAAQQRQQAFQQAQQAAQYDIGQRMQADTLNQQAAEMAAAREQAARSGNMQAANQFAIQQAQFEQAANQANMAARNATRGMQAQFRQAAGMAGSAQDAARAAQQAGLTQAAGLSSMGALNTAGQQQAAREQAARQAMFGGQFQGAGIRQGAAGGLSGLAQQGFNIGSQIQQQQAQQGLLQQGLQQALIDAARGQYAGFTGAPAASLSAPLAALGATPGQSTTTQTQTPGLFNYLQTLAMMQGFCWVAREVYGKDDPRWLEFRDWVVGFSPDWFFNAYGKYGERVANIVKKVPILKSIIKPFMDAKRKSIGYE